MGKVRARKENNNLYLDFQYKNVRCREQTELKDTPANRKKAEALLKRIEAKIMLDQFNYAEVFPTSKNIRKFIEYDEIQAEIDLSGGIQGPRRLQNSNAPAFKDFAECNPPEKSQQLFIENSICDASGVVIYLYIATQLLHLTV